MEDLSTEVQNAIIEMRDLLRLMAEPAIAERDQKHRDELRRIVATSIPKSKSVLLMDGTRTQSEIHAETSINKGHLSTLTKQLREVGLVSDDGKQPKLSISIPADFFESKGGTAQ